MNGELDCEKTNVQRKYSKCETKILESGKNETFIIIISILLAISYHDATIKSTRIMSTIVSINKF